MTLPKKTIENHCGALGVISRVPMMVDEEIPFRHPGVRICQLGFRSLDVVQLCDAFEQKRLSDAECSSVFEGTYPTSFASCVGRNFARDQNQRHGDGRERVEVVLVVPSDSFASSWTTGMISKPKLVARFEMCVRGEWQALLEAEHDCASKAATIKSRRTRIKRGLKHRREPRSLQDRSRHSLR